MLTVRPGALQESFGGNFDLRPYWDPARKVFEHDVPAFFAPSFACSTTDVAGVM